VARVSLIPTLVRETVGNRTLPREPEPDLVMDGHEQVEAYALAGRIGGIMSAAYLFHSAQISSVIAGYRNVIDLGCGPATQLGQIAQLNPGVQFLGVDLSDTMIESARTYVAELQLSNVALVRDDIARLDSIADNSADAVISTMAFHHLPTISHLEACFTQIRRILRPDGALYLVDFGRLKSLKSVIFFAYMNRNYQPHIFSLDYERSLRAAFLFDELRGVAAGTLPASAGVYATFLVPFLTVIKTPGRPLTAELLRQLRSMRRSLPKKYRRDLDELRRFFRLGGLSPDPFRDGI
jgi:arsenite methyltransferase